MAFHRKESPESLTDEVKRAMDLVDRWTRIIANDLENIPFGMVRLKMYSWMLLIAFHTFIGESFVDS